MAGKEKRVNIYFKDLLLHKKATKYAAKKGRSLSGLICDLLRELFEKGGK